MILVNDQIAYTQNGLFYETRLASNWQKWIEIWWDNILGLSAQYMLNGDLCYQSEQN